MAYDNRRQDGNSAPVSSLGVARQVVRSASKPGGSGVDKCPIRASFADIIRTGGDALLWALIRIALEEIEDEDLAELCENRGFIVRLPRSADAAP